ncbi:MAG: D-tyrosyl-tRNA(Tyr) deacylase [Flavobacteriaceae bacterium]|nr:D-tyrosyl-tRNA(Tyr) deacylase [Flavobacteriaceae bacterium]
MRVTIQRVSEASVIVSGAKKASINTGLLILLGVTQEDTSEDIEWLVNKITRLRIFPDENLVMNSSIMDCDGDIIVVSQFTLYASTKKGNRPSYIRSAKPDIAIPLYEKFVATLEKELKKEVQTGVFGADMKVALINDGPVTINIDSKNRE